MIGERLNHYRIIGPLGSGGMGEVYAADDTKLGRRVAVKILPAAMSSSRERLVRFEREARAVAALNHPNVVTIHSVEQDGDVHFLTMELVEGKPVSDLIPPGGFPLRKVLEIAIPLTEAIGAAHRNGIVHRDLKPSNLMLAPDGRLKVLDFGLAKLREDVHAENVSSAGTLVNVSAEHVVLGTAAYMSPEQAEGQSVDHRSDVFSLGIVLYELCTGRRPFQGTTTAAVISSILRDAPPPLSQVRPDLPQDLGRIVTRCLDKDPERRYQSAIDIRNDLEELQQLLSQPAVVPPPRRQSWIAPALAVLLIASAAAAAWLWYRRRPIPPSTPVTAKFTPLTSAPGAELFPSLSPDGKWFVYSGQTSGNRDIYLQSVGGSLPINLTRDCTVDDTQPVFSPDGESIAFRSAREGGGIFVMGRTGEAVRRVTRSGFNPSWSPDGKRLAYSSEGVETQPMNWVIATPGIFIVEVNGGEPRSLNAGPAVQPAWSPDGRRIVCVIRSSGPTKVAQLDIASLPVDGGSPVTLTNDTATDWSPVWAPDGKYVYFSSDRGGSMNLWRIPVDQTTGKALGVPQAITTPATFLAAVSMSGDGSRIAYSSVLETQNIQRLELDDGRVNVKGEPFWLTTGSRLWSSADPSPDGEWIAFYSRAQPEGDLYVVRRDGTGLRQVTGDESVDRVPRWSPDGKWIAFFSNRGGSLELWKIRPDGSDLQQMKKGPGPLAVWSPDGSRMVVSDFRTTATTSATLYFFDPAKPWDAQQPEDVTVSTSFLPMSWSPDGRHIAGQSSGWSTTAGLAVYDPATRKVEPLIDHGEWPVWLDDHRVLFVFRGEEFDVIDVRTKQVRTIFSVDRDVIGPPRLTRQGEIYFSRRATEADVWLADLVKADQ